MTLLEKKIKGTINQELNGELLNRTKKDGQWSSVDLKQKTNKKNLKILIGIRHMMQLIHQKN
jgi:hypothetical protein